MMRNGIALSRFRAVKSDVARRKPHDPARVKSEDWILAASGYLTAPLDQAPL